VQGEGLSSPEQFGIWEVEGVGLVVAFRGTASTEDVLVDVNIRPMPLATSKSMRGRVLKILQCCVWQNIRKHSRGRHYPAIPENSYSEQTKLRTVRLRSSLLREHITFQRLIRGRTIRPVPLAAYRNMWQGKTHGFLSFLSGQGMKTCSWMSTSHAARHHQRHAR